MASNPLTSTLIDDGDLLDQLRLYGETNLPILPGQGSSNQKMTRSKRGAKVNYLNDSNRDIYLKKLNHYKAREKVVTNPSKQYLKTKGLGAGDKPIDIKRISNIYKINDDFELDGDDDIQEIEEIDCKDDVIELNKTEYVQVVNGCTSPLSMSDYDHNNSKIFNEEDDYVPSILSSTRAPSIGQAPIRSPNTQAKNYASQPTIKTPEQQKNALGYVKMKDRIELDETLSKYRMDIENILHNSVRRNRLNEGSAAARYLNDDVLNNYQKSPNSQKITYVPKAVNEPKAESTGIFKSLYSMFGKSEKSNTHSESHEGLRKRQTSYKNEQPNLPQLPSKAPKEPNSVFATVGSFISDAGLQIAKFLPYLVLILLTIVALQYFHLKLNTENSDLESSISTNIVEKISNDKYQTPASSGMDAQKTEQGLYCSDIKDTQCSETKQLLKEIIDYLRQRAGAVECSSSTSKTSIDDLGKIHFAEKCVHLNEIMDYLIDKRGLIKNPELNKNIAVSSILSAISKNPHWRVILLNESFQEVNETDSVTYLVSMVSSKSFMCRLKELVYFIYVRAMIFVLAIVALLLCYFIFKVYMKNREAKDKEYYDLITKVTGMVEKQYELSLMDPANIKPYIAISHIYDSLVDPSERAAKKQLWNKVVAFIQDHESRIHLETQFISGEETHVWKWIGAKHDTILKNKYKNTGIGLANSTMINPENNKQNMPAPPVPPRQVEPVQPNGWQGSAFNNSEKLVYSPTPCLKIRNMFDLEEFDKDRLLPSKIHNDILEKCMINNMNKTIYHIACDKKSREGCTYIKCASNDAAGLVYQALNGTWYNGKLLNVKFLRSDRYLERFPDSISYNQPIKLIKL